MKSGRSLHDRDETKYVEIPKSTTFSTISLAPLSSLNYNPSDSVSSIDMKYLHDSSTFGDNNSILSSIEAPELVLQGSLKLPPPKSYCDILSLKERDIFHSTIKKTRGILSKKQS